jgi:hypothetical protein
LEKFAFMISRLYFSSTSLRVKKKQYISD